MKIQWLQKKSYMVWIAALLLAMTGLPNCVSAAEPSATAAIEIENRITGDTPKKKAKFTFVLEPAKPDSPVPAKGTSLTITGKGKGKFGTISYTQPGEYVYTVRGETEELSGYTFDTAVYQIKVNALYDDGGRLYTQMSVKKSGAKAKSGAIVLKTSIRLRRRKKYLRKCRCLLQKRQRLRHPPGLRREIRRDHPQSKREMTIGSFSGTRFCL